MVVGDEIEAVALRLRLDGRPHRAEIVADVEVPEGVMPVRVRISVLRG
jgi:hypothetical protein